MLEEKGGSADSYRTKTAWKAISVNYSKVWHTHPRVSIKKFGVGPAYGARWWLRRAGGGEHRCPRGTRGWYTRGNHADSQPLLHLSMQGADRPAPQPTTTHTAFISCSHSRNPASLDQKEPSYRKQSIVSLPLWMYLWRLFQNVWGSTTCRRPHSWDRAGEPKEYVGWRSRGVSPAP